MGMSEVLKPNKQNSALMINPEMWMSVHIQQLSRDFTFNQNCHSKQTQVITEGIRIHHLGTICSKVPKYLSFIKLKYTILSFTPVSFGMTNSQQSFSSLSQVNLGWENESSLFLLRMCCKVMLTRSCASLLSHLFDLIIKHFSLKGRLPQAK